VLYCVHAAWQTADTGAYESVGRHCCSVGILSALLLLYLSDCCSARNMTMSVILPVVVVLVKEVK